MLAGEQIADDPPPLLDRRQRLAELVRFRGKVLDRHVQGAYAQFKFSQCLRQDIRNLGAHRLFKPVALFLGERADQVILNRGDGTRLQRGLVGALLCNQAMARRDAENQPIGVDQRMFAKDALEKLNCRALLVRR